MDSVQLKFEERVCPVVVIGIIVSKQTICSMIDHLKMGK